MRRAGDGPHFMRVIINGDALDISELLVHLDVMDLWVRKETRIRGLLRLKRGNRHGKVQVNA